MHLSDDRGFRLHGNASHPLRLIYEDGGVWVFKPKTLRNGIVLYGKVLSLRDGRKVYDLKKERMGVSQFNYTCTCTGNFLGRHLCQHIARFKLAEWCLANRVRPC